MVTKRGRSTQTAAGAAAKRGISAKRYLSEAFPSLTKKGNGSKANEIDVAAIRERIEKKAYELYEQRGYTHGGDQNDWYQAEQIVKKELSKR